MNHPAAGSRPRMAFYSCTGCGGCDRTAVDLHERVPELTAQMEIVFWPVALDFKRRDVEALADEALAITFVNGAIRTTEHQEMLQMLRRKSQLLVAFGACAHMGGVPGLSNLWNGNTVRTLAQVVAVDCVVPGCPPTPELLADAVRMLLSDDRPPQGTVVASDRALCDTCPRRLSRPDHLRLAEFRRTHEIVADEMTCLLAQGLACLGPATRGGCQSRCIAANMPCTGCFGPTSRVSDFGAKAASALASVLDADNQPDIDRKLDALADPMGIFYRYSLPNSLINRKRQTRRS